MEARVKTYTRDPISSTYKFPGSPHPILLSGCTSRCKNLEFVVFNVNLFRYGRANWKVALLNYHRCIIDAYHEIGEHSFEKKDDSNKEVTISEGTNNVPLMELGKYVELLSLVSLNLQ